VHLHPDYPIVGRRVQLRPVLTSDVDAMLTYRSRPDVCRFLPFEPMTREQLAGRLRSDLARTELTDEGQALTLGVELLGADQLIGDVVLFFRSRRHGGGELGYVFHPEAGGQGYATEACALMLALAFDQLGLHRVIARLDARNHPSARMASRLGMRQEARLVRNELFKGEWSDELDFAMLTDEWPDSPAARLVK
jgi:RimJ/RimL family protein N-acetyltransferase